MSFFDGFLTYLSILQIYDCFWMFGTNLEGSQRPVRTLQFKPQVGAKWCSYLELALSVNFFLIFRAFYSIKMEFFEAATKFFSKLTTSHINSGHSGAPQQSGRWEFGLLE